MVVKQGKYFLKHYPQHMILLSLIFTTFIGTFLLALPWSRTTAIPIIDIFFTSASLTTVTGMMTVPISHFSDFGHFIILLLMQFGGLGLMTLSLFFIYMFLDVGIYTQVVATEILSLQSIKDTKRILFFMFKLTFIAELIGAILIFPTLYKDYSLYRALFLSVFHSVSSFCNAGFSLFNNGIEQYSSCPSIILPTIFLMVAGGLGFITWHEFLYKIKEHNHKKKISWHTKIVLRVYAFTSIVSGILFWMLERNNSLANMPLFQKLYTVIFTSISMKSTGLFLFHISSIHLASVVICMAMMFIGSAPLSTGSGIKASVFAIYIAVIRAAIMGKQHAVIHGRHIVDEQVYKAMAIIALSLSWIMVTTFCLLITEPSILFIDVFFESVSAFCNNGLSMGITPMLSNLGKSFIMITMIVGRIGALALILSMKRIPEYVEISYPKERVILG